MRDNVLSFIRHFSKASDVFLNGCCYWFAYILQGRFGGTMMYEPVENHFVQEIDGRLYDCSGDVTDEYSSRPRLMPWSEVERYDELLYWRIVRDCIVKEGHDG